MLNGMLFLVMKILLFKLVSLFGGGGGLLCTVSVDRAGFNSPYQIYQRFCHINEAKWSFCIELTLKPLLHVVLNKRKCACRLNSNKDHSLS